MLARRRLFPVLVAAALLGSGCSGQSADGDPTPPPPPPAQPVWPLTGLPDMPSDNQDQIVTVKVDNTSSGRPRVGLDSAEIVVQELVEGGFTRLAAMYHEQYPDQVGAVRSMRATDAGIVLPTDGTLASSGGERWTRRGLRALGVPLAVEEAPGFSRATDRPIPYNLMLDVRQLGDSLEPVAAPEPYLPFGDLPADVSGRPADSITLTWPAATSRFDYDPDTARWTLADAADAGDPTYTNVLAVFVPVEFTSGNDVAGTPIPTMLTEGTGRAVLATGGQVSRIEWQKQTAASQWTFTYEPVTTPGGSGEPTSGDAGGSAESGDGGGSAESGDGASPLVSAPAAAPLLIPPGRTWIALLPDTSGSIETTKPTPLPAESPQ